MKGAARFTISFIFVFMVICSPIVIFVGPAVPNVSAAPLPTVNAIPSAPSTIGQDGKEGDFSTQAALSLTRATQTSNIVDTKAYYDVSFRTSTAGVIKFIRMSFPAGTYLGAALLVEATGIGPGTISAGAGGNTLAYTVTDAVNVPANTNIRIQVSNANNPASPSNSLTVSITTRDSANAIIDGPTSTNTYNIKQIESSDIADNSITSTKPAESLMKRVTLLDNAGGNAAGWDPNGVTTGFIITEPEITGADTSFPTIAVRLAGNAVCTVGGWNGDLHRFTFVCTPAPAEGGQLHYVVENLPSHVVS